MNFPKLKLKDPSTPALFGSHNLNILKAVLRANRKNPGLGTFRMFPYSASEANRPQKVKTGKK